MATITHIDDVLVVVETDLPAAALSRIMEAAEQDIIGLLPEDDRAVAMLGFTARQEQAVIDLVQLRLEYDGLSSVSYGDYARSSGDYHLQRAKVLSRLMFAGSESIVF